MVGVECLECTEPIVLRSVFTLAGVELQDLYTLVTQSVEEQQILQRQICPTDLNQGLKFYSTSGANKKIIAAYPRIARSPTTFSNLGVEFSPEAN